MKEKKLSRNWYKGVKTLHKEAEDARRTLALFDWIVDEHGKGSDSIHIGAGNDNELDRLVKLELISVEDIDGEKWAKIKFID